LINTGTSRTGARIKAQSAIYQTNREQHCPSSGNIVEKFSPPRPVHTPIFPTFEKKI
jgi:hypothetical protein